MTRIKICGITNFKDALAAVSLEVDALGFVFYPKSPRYISPENLRQFRGQIPASPLCIGVFVNERKERVLQIAQQCQLDGLQFHGNESPKYCSYFSQYKVIKAFSPKTRSDLERIKRYRIQAILVDASDPLHFGGSGRKADWHLAREAKKLGPLVLAGGLNVTNVQEAIRIVSPYAGDASSGLEIIPGVKDHEQMKRFVEKVREKISKS